MITEMLFLKKMRSGIQWCPKPEQQPNQPFVVFSVGNIRLAATVQEATAKPEGKKKKWRQWWRIRADDYSSGWLTSFGAIHFIEWRWTAGRRLVQEKQLWIRGLRSPFPEQGLRRACVSLIAIFFRNRTPFSWRLWTPRSLYFSVQYFSWPPLAF